MMYPDFRIDVSDLTPEAQKIVSEGGYEVSIDKLHVSFGCTRYQVMRKKPRNKRMRCFASATATSSHSRKGFIKSLSKMVVRAATE